MRQSYKFLAAFLLCLFGAGVLRAQDPEFTQFYANPLYLNPALAGNKLCTRVGINYRVQWPGVYGTYSTVGVSIDKLAYRIKSGLGLMIMNDRAAKGTLNTTGIGVIFYPTIPITKKVSISTAIQAGYWQKTVNWSKLTFGDMIDPQRGFIYSTDETPTVTSRGNFDLAAGTVINSRHFFAGFAVHHILEPNESFLGGESKLPRKYTFHAGANIPLTKSRYQDETYISPNILYQAQGDFRQLNLGLYAKKGGIVGGLWYRGNDSFIVLIGLESGKGRIGYSYDVTISKLTNATAGAHEISLGYTFSCKVPPKKYRPGICPSF